MYDTSSKLPDRVIKRDGQLVPFDADKISRALFAVGESLGRPDAFLARELTDGIVHFLAVEGEDDTPTTARIAELVVKVVRELGQPALAEAFADGGLRRKRGLALPAGSKSEIELSFPADMAPAAVLDAFVRKYTLQSVFARDIAAAQADGLLTLTGLEHPCELEGCVLGPWDGNSAQLCEAIEAARRLAGRFVALDGPEYGLTNTGESDARAFARELDIGTRITGLSAVVNLNVTVAPPWAGDLAGGPLFERQTQVVELERRMALADELFDELLKGLRGNVRVDWHLSARDFAPEARGRLEQKTRAALDGAPVAFTFDRAKRPLSLAAGADRSNPAVLLTVAIHLPRLAAQAGVEGDPARFLRKLASLARLALSASVQKRAFLRQQERSRPEGASNAPAISAGFLLDRARLVVAPTGLDAVARRFTGAGLVTGGQALEFGKQVVVVLRDVLRQDGRSTLMETCVDGPESFALAGKQPDASSVVGLTPWEKAPVREQLRAGGALQSAAEGGTLALFLPDDKPPDAGEAADWLRLAWQRSEVTRLRFVLASTPS